MTSNTVLSSTSGTTNTDTKLDVRIVLAGLWIAMTLVVIGVDLYSFYRAETIESALAGELHDVGFTIDQGFLVFALAFVAIPAIMLVVSLIAPQKWNRRLNIGVSVVYALAVIGGCIGESWIYYLAGSFIEVVLLVMIATTARSWTTSTSSAIPATSERQTSGIESQSMTDQLTISAISDRQGLSV